MTDLSMLVYLKAKKDDNFLGEIYKILDVPGEDDDEARKEAFANAYAAWLIGRDRWADFVSENEIEL